MVRCEDIELYAWHSLPQDELEAWDEHVHHCSSCARALPALQEAVALLASAVQPVKPPARLKMAVMTATASTTAASDEAELANDKKPQRWTPLLLVAASLALAFVLGSTFTSTDTPEAPSPNFAATATEKIMQAKDASTVSRRVGSGRVSMLYSEDLNSAVFSAEQMQKIDAKQKYQLWLQDAKGVLSPAGSFQPGGEKLVAITSGIKDAKAVGLTVEPEGKTTQPTTAPLVFMQL